MSSRLLPLLVLLALLLLAAPAWGQNEVNPVDIIDVSGPLDGFAVDFILDEVKAAATTGSQAVILQLDSTAALTDRVDEVIALVQDPPVPVAVWVGPAPAHAYGGVAQILLAAEYRMAAPGAEIGYLTPRVAGGHEGVQVIAGIVSEGLSLTDSVVEVGDPPPAWIDAEPPSIRQAVAALDGIALGGRTLHTVHTVTVEGEEVVTPVTTRFREPGVVERAARTALRPEATFFFLAAGLTLVAFEFYAAGPGVAAAVAAIALLMGGYGLASLPLHWWGVVLLLLGIWLFTVDYQRGRFSLLSWAGAALLTVAGFTYTAGAPQVRPTWWGVLLTVAGVWLFYQFAMPTVARSRFSTPTIGRAHLIGRSGVAATEFDPDGVVDVQGARWRATAHREAGIGVGDAVVITGIDGLFLEVDRLDPPQE